MFRFRGIFVRRFYAGALILVAGAASAQAAAKEKVLHSFTGFTIGQDGGLPYGSVVRDDAGNLYGTTFNGGANDYGTVFKLSPNGQETVLHSFANDGNDGTNPQAGVVLDSQGNIYGTTRNGSAHGVGILFKLTPLGTETVLHIFAGGANKDGGRPQADLIMDNAGNIYGTTHIGGGKGDCNADTCGTVFKFAPDGSETILHRFTGGKDGGYPSAPLILDEAGNLYGTAETGGNADGCGSPGCGVVFKMSPAGKETVLYAFNGTDGRDPVAGLVRDVKGNFYGTTNGGGSANAGVVFKLTPKGKETVLRNFNLGGDNGGVGPQGSLVMDAKGFLYGTTANGGLTNNGVVYKITQKGKLTVLYPFAGGDDGANPFAGVILDSQGAIYGTTNRGGGTTTDGTVFRIKP
jgi:uncharacterized repeat protein (TIGR03803 family)